MTTVFRVLGAMAVLSPAVCFGEVIFHDPIPYRSIADSPFDMSGLGKTFFFDDFEDGTFDFPDGVFSSPFMIETPGPLTDSVDADDGDIDGNGSGGHALKPESRITINLTNPPQFIKDYVLYFDSKLLASYPNSFGVVLTDGMPNSYHVMEVNEGNGYVSRVYLPPLDNDFNGGASEDRFFAVTSTQGIRSLSILNAYWVRSR